MSTIQGKVNGLMVKKVMVYERDDKEKDVFCHASAVSSW